MKSDNYSKKGTSHEDALGVRKLHPKLRMIMNGDSKVNAVRAERSAAIAVNSDELLEIKQCRRDGETPMMQKKPADKRKKLEGVPDDISATVFLRLTGNSAMRSERFAKNLSMMSQELAVDLIDQVGPMFERREKTGSPGDDHIAAQQKQGREGSELEELDSMVNNTLHNIVTESVRLTGISAQLPKKLDQAVTASRGNLMTAEVSLDMLEKLKSDESLSSLINDIELGENIVFSPPINVHSSSDDIEPPDRSVPDTTDEEGQLGHLNGEGVLIGIIDVQGFDFSHPDFLDKNGKTRFHSIWDQGGESHAPPNGYSDGAEILKEHMDKAIEKSNAFGLPASELQPQSQRVRSSHGTHVASIAAGNSGVCSKATLIGVSLSLADEETDRRQSFFDSTRLALAIEYLLGMSELLSKDGKNPMPLSINISLGTNGHAHDGSSAINQWLDHALTIPGRSICVAAGNSGQQAPITPDDMGHITGRIHTSGRLPAAGLTKNIEWIVGAAGIADLSENELELWYSMQDRLAIAVRPPGSNTWIGPVEPGEMIENKILDSGTVISIYNELYSPANGDNYIACYLSPKMGEEGSTGVQSGTWSIRLFSREVRDGRYHAWIERDDPRRFGRVGSTLAGDIPSFFSAASNVDDSSVSSLGCSERVITVANLDADRESIHITSSQGPSRDGRPKPEIAASGTNVLAANGFDVENKKWVKMTGSSMASPFVTGVAGLMLAVEPKLTAAQIAGIMRRSTRPLPGANFEWQNDAGFGEIDPEACIRDAARLKQRTDKTSS